MQAICPKCGVELAKSASFCHKCGEQISPDAPEQSSSEAEEREVAVGQSAAEDTRNTSAPEVNPQMAPEPQTPLERFQQQSTQRSGDADDQEEDLWSGRYSSRAMIGAWVVAGLVTLCGIGVAIGFSFGGTGWIWTIVLLLLMWAAFYLRLVYRQLNVSYHFTTQRFVHEQGILRRVTDRIEVIDMDDISFEQGPIERLLNVGTIKISSSDRSHPEISLCGIENVKEVSRKIDDARRAERRRRGLHIESI